jgi:phosphomannomutase
MMVNLRENPVNEINGQRVICIDDYENSTSLNRMTNEIEPLTIPKSNVLIYYLEDGSKICARPSGTEPKIKFYFSVNAPLYQVEDFDEVATELDQKITNIIAAMHLN